MHGSIWSIIDWDGECGDRVGNRGFADAEQLSEPVREAHSSSLREAWQHDDRSEQRNPGMGFRPPNQEGPETVHYEVKEYVEVPRPFSDAGRSHDWYVDSCWSLIIATKFCTGGMACAELANFMRNPRTLQFQNWALEDAQHTKAGWWHISVADWDLHDYVQEEHDGFVDLHSVVAVTASRKQATATRCADYIRQTWKKTGPSLYVLRILETWLKEADIGSKFEWVSSYT